MKKINLILYALAICGLLFTSCDQYDNQYVAKPGAYEQDTLQDNTFIIEATVSSYTIEESVSEDSVGLLTISTAPVPLDSAVTVSYLLQLSSNENFTDTISPAFSINGSSVNVKNEDLNTAVLTLTDSENESEIFVRLIACFTKGGLKTMHIGETSGGVSVLGIMTTPYSILKPYTEVGTVYPYYIVGLGENWNNSVEGLGSSLIPLGLVTGNAYHSDGKGTFEYTGYFSAADGFKIVGNVGSWDEQWGSSDGALTPVHNNSGSSNFSVPADGYYTITLNSIKNEMTIEEATVSPATYSSIGLIGDINGWGSDEVMTANQSSGGHIWYLTYTFNGDYTDGVKFRANADWTNNWGAAEFPQGIGVSGGSNIPYKAGTYTIIFNDITNCYYFIKN